MAAGVSAVHGGQCSGHPPLAYDSDRQTNESQEQRVARAPKHTQDIAVSASNDSCVAPAAVSAASALARISSSPSLGETHFTQTPVRYGQCVAKLSLAPVSAELQQLANAPVDLRDKPDGLREATINHFAQRGGEWEMRVQLCTDLASMPIEDASVEWPQDKSPCFTLAKLHAAPQTGWSKTRSAAIDDGMAFDPWHALAAHQPRGSIMRARKVAYEVTSKVRARQNHLSITEPTALALFVAPD